MTREDAWEWAAVRVTISPLRCAFVGGGTFHLPRPMVPNPEEVGRLMAVAVARSILDAPPDEPGLFIHVMHRGPVPA